MKKVKEKNQQKNFDSQMVDCQLKNIDIFFAAFGPFIAGIFTIFHYFFAQYRLFNILSSIMIFLILGITYFMAYSKWATTLLNFWTCVKKCAHAVGILNPIALVLSMMFSITKSFISLIPCIEITVFYLVLYTIIIKKSLNQINEKTEQILNC